MNGLPYSHKENIAVMALLAFAMLAFSLSSTIPTHVPLASLFQNRQPAFAAQTPEQSVADVVEKAVPSTVTIVASFEGDRAGTIMEEDNGSGFVVGKDGKIITNKHVVAKENVSYSVRLANNKTYPVEQVETDDKNDIALLSIKAQNLTPVTLGESSSVRLGERVIAIGTIFGNLTNSVTTGVISGTNRSIYAESSKDDEATNITNLLQTDAAINPGNSGGPLFNTKGEVIGVNTAASVYGQDVGFAIPVDEIKNFLRNTEEPGKQELSILRMW